MQMATVKCHVYRIFDWIGRMYNTTPFSRAIAIINNSIVWYFSVFHFIDNV